MPPYFSKNQPVDIGARIEPLIDDWLLDRSSNVCLRLHAPVKREVVLTTDKRWEAPSSSYFSVFQDGPVIRLYYRGFHALNAPDEAPRQFTCYAESKDGIHFERPNLGLYEFEGSTANNIVYAGVEAHNFAPFLDTNPAAKPGERYKAVGGVGAAEGLHAFVSADGLAWKKMRRAPVMTKGELDSLNIVFWDEQLGVYRCFARYIDRGEPGTAVRAIWSMSSPNLIDWSAPVPHRYREGVPLEHFYTNATVPLPSAPHILLSFPMRFMECRKKVDEHPSNGVSDAIFMSSRDGVHWDRTFREAWIRPGRDRHNWTDRCSMTARGIVATAPNEYSLYVSENYSWPENRLRRYTVRRDGFVSLYAGHDKGEWTTRPLICGGANLVLNYSTSAVGSLQVEVQDECGVAIPGYELGAMEPLYGDEIDAVARWRGCSDLSAIRGRAVRFHFVMENADLFSLRTASPAVDC